MEIKQSFQLCQKDKEKIQNLNFRIAAYEQFLSFLMNQIKYENAISIDTIKDWMTEYSDKLIGMREEYVRLQEKFNEQFEDNILTIPFVSNIRCELNSEKGTIDYTYEIKDICRTT